MTGEAYADYGKKLSTDVIGSAITYLTGTNGDQQMEKVKKYELFAIIEKFEKANKRIEIKRDIDIDELFQLQQMALDLGTYIESVYSEIDVTCIIDSLEAYCEYLYELCQIETDDAIRKDKKKIKNLLVLLFNNIRHMIPEDKKVIIFLPYKASMWDSLESIWMAAKEDDEYESYVIPIPYFDKNPDGSLGRMHYEGNEYPDYVPITSWEDYNIESCRPDMIFIHNPYDEFNLVTSVHPRFYAKALKDYTDKLVYIPYFVLPEISPNNQAAIESVKHFCFLPGTIYANKVILQSENIRQIYMNEFALKTANTNLCLDRKQLQEKFLALGSPKVDRVLHTEKEDLIIPDDWLRLIEKPDGSWKKIIFYNISISALLRCNEKMLSKIKDVFRIFKENQEEVVMLWRPHPLLRATINSMCPQLEEEYDKIVAQYKEEGWGIYDDTADMNRALCLCDAYYGTSSSVVQLAKKVGKPVMIQNENKVEE